MEARQTMAWLNRVDIVISSPAMRCATLAQRLAIKYSCQHKVMPGLREMDFGQWEGSRWDDIPRTSLDAWSRDMLNFEPPGGESALALVERVENCLHDILEMPEQHIAVVTHGGPIRAILSILAEVSLQQLMAWQIDPGAVVQVKIGGA